MKMRKKNVSIEGENDDDGSAESSTSSLSLELTTMPSSSIEQHGLNSEEQQHKQESSSKRRKRKRSKSGNFMISDINDEDYSRRANSKDSVVVRSDCEMVMQYDEVRYRRRKNRSSSRESSLPRWLVARTLLILLVVNWLCCGKEDTIWKLTNNLIPGAEANLFSESPKTVRASAEEDLVITTSFLETRTIELCKSSLRQADSNTDGKLVKSEYLDFLSLRTQGEIDEESFRDVPILLVLIFVKTACQCKLEEGTSDDCCLKDNAHVITTDDGSDRAEAYLDQFCVLFIEEALKDLAMTDDDPTFPVVPTPTPPPPPPPTSKPIPSPSHRPSKAPSSEPTVTNSNKPSSAPTITQTNTPSSTPTLSPTLTNEPSLSPSEQHSNTPSHPPSSNPTLSLQPSTSPSAPPTTSRAPSIPPSSSPSFQPTHVPSSSPTITTQPSIQPSPSPTELMEAPSDSPSVIPTLSPSGSPSMDPTQNPTRRPTDRPTSARPTERPTQAPTKFTPQRVCVDFSYGLSHRLGIDAEGIMNGVNNTLKAGLLSATRTVVIRILNETYDRPRLLSSENYYDDKHEYLSEDGEEFASFPFNVDEAGFDDFVEEYSSLSSTTAVNHHRDRKILHRPVIMTSPEEQQHHLLRHSKQKKRRSQQREYLQQRQDIPSQDPQRPARIRNKERQSHPKQQQQQQQIQHSPIIPNPRQRKRRRKLVFFTDDVPVNIYSIIDNEFSSACSDPSDPNLRCILVKSEVCVFLDNKDEDPDDVRDTIIDGLNDSQADGSFIEAYLGNL